MDQFEIDSLGLKNLIMKKNILVSMALILSNMLYAQNVGIGTNTPNSSAKLDVTSSNSGLLIPRILLASTTDVVTIPSPATSLLV